MKYQNTTCSNYKLFLDCQKHYYEQKTSFLDYSNSYNSNIHLLNIWF